MHPGPFFFPVECPGLFAAGSRLASSGRLPTRIGRISCREGSLVGSAALLVCLAPRGLVFSVCLSGLLFFVSTLSPNVPRVSRVLAPCAAITSSRSRIICFYQQCGLPAHLGAPSDGDRYQDPATDNGLTLWLARGVGFLFCLFDFHSDMFAFCLNKITATLVPLWFYVCFPLSGPTPPSSRPLADGALASGTCLPVANGSLHRCRIV